MTETNASIEVNEKIDEVNNKYYCRVSLYHNCEDLNMMNGRFFLSLITKANKHDRSNDYIFVVGTGFLRSYTKIFKASFQKKAKIDLIYLSTLNRLSPVFRSLNENSLFVLPRKDLDKIEKIWD